MPERKTFVNSAWVKGSANRSDAARIKLIVARPDSRPTCFPTMNMDRAMAAAVTRAIAPRYTAADTPTSARPTVDHWNANSHWEVAPTQRHDTVRSNPTT